MKRRAFLIVAAMGMVVLMTSSSWSTPPSPSLGVDGDIVDLPRRSVVPPSPDYPNRGFRITRVHPRTPAAAMGLERGDIIISIDTMRFTSMKGLRHALVCAGQRPSILIVNVRTGNFVRRSVNLPHREPDFDYCVPQPPDSYGMSIDLESDMRR